MPCTDITKFGFSVQAYWSKADAADNKKYSMLKNPNFLQIAKPEFTDFRYNDQGIRMTHKSGAESYVHRDDCGNVIIDVDDSKGIKRGHRRYEAFNDLSQLLNVTLVSRRPFVIPIATLERIAKERIQT